MLMVIGLPSKLLAEIANKMKITSILDNIGIFLGF